MHNDIIIKWIFSRPQYPLPLLGLLNAIMDYHGKKIRFKDVRILNPYDSTEPYTQEKQGILDIRTQEVSTEEWIDLEVQVIVCADYGARAQYYLAGLYREQLKRSQYKNYDELKPCYGIHILIQTYFEDKDDEKHWFNHYTMLNTRSHKPLLNHWNLYFIEIKKKNIHLLNSGVTI